MIKKKYFKKIAVAVTAAVAVEIAPVEIEPMKNMQWQHSCRKDSNDYEQVAKRIANIRLTGKTD